MVEEPTESEAVEILEGIAYKYAEHHQVTITHEALEAAVKLSDRYINLDASIAPSAPPAPINVWISSRNR